MSFDRFTVPLYGIGEAASCISVPPSTLSSWAYGYERRARGGSTARARPVITAVRPAHRDDAAVPFIGLAEAYALSAFRKAGVPMQRIRPAVDALADELGLEHALASQRLYTDGAEVTVDPDHAFGRPRMTRGGAEVENVVDLFLAGEPVDAVAAEFGLSRDEVEDVLRASARPAA